MLNYKNDKKPQINKKKDPLKFNIMNRTDFSY